MENDNTTEAPSVTKKEVVRKLTSRKFWICTAAFLGSVAAGIAGIQTGNEVVATVGIVCGVASSAIYAAAEAAVDAERAKGE